MSKCLGCGSILTMDHNLDGYTSNLENRLCERCFRIKNYNEYKTVSHNNNDYYKIIDSIKAGLTVLVIDLFDIPTNLKELVNHLNNDVILVLTKYDLIPSNYDDKFLKYVMDNYNLNVLDAMVVSAKNNYHIDELYHKLISNTISSTIYFVGFTNAGKSSLINKLIYNYSNHDTKITTSSLPSTTLNTIEIKIDNLTLIDTPGIVDDKSILNNVVIEQIKKIVPKHKIKPITYQIKTMQTIEIEDLFGIECMKSNNLIFYISNGLKINRYYREASNNLLDKHHIKVDDNNDIVIPGLGFIRVLKRDEFNIYLPKKVGYYIRKSIM